MATPPGEGGVAVVRLSGAEAERVLARIFWRPQGPPTWASHRLYHGFIREPDESDPVDEVLAVVMWAPRSYTGETVAEVHCHGGPVVVGMVLDLAVRCGARLARPGEFTLRAFLNGRLDLAQAESVLALIQARSRLAARLASAGVAGGLSRRVRQVREDLLDWLARLEAEIDFGDEVPGLSPGESERRLESARAAVTRVLAGAAEARCRAEGVRAVLVGPTNVGKSTLLNRLLGEERALVTSVAGTTRDWLEEATRVGDFVLRVVDTAGLRRSTDPVEGLGMARTREAAATAEVLVVLLDGSEGWPECIDELVDLSRGRASLVVLNKRDRGVALTPEAAGARFGGAEVCETCLLDPGAPAGLEAAMARLAARVVGERADEVHSLSARQAEVLARCAGHLEDLAEALSGGLPVDCLAADLRLAVQALGEVTGDDLTADLLDRVFSTFCLGK